MIKSKKLENFANALKDAIQLLSDEEADALKDELIQMIDNAAAKKEAHPALSFEEWLEKQDFRNDPIGDLAKNRKLTSITSYKDSSISWDVMDCAEREYIAYRESCEELCGAPEYFSHIHFEEEQKWDEILNMQCE